MNIEDEDAATKPDDTSCVEAKPTDETPVQREIEFAAKESPALPQAEPNEPAEAEAHRSSIGSEEPQLPAPAPLPPVEATGITEQQTKRDETTPESVDDEAPTAEKAPSVTRKADSPPKVAGFFQEQP